MNEPWLEEVKIEMLKEVDMQEFIPQSTIFLLKKIR